jgi:hypothetical protein
MLNQADRERPSSSCINGNGKYTHEKISYENSLYAKTFN